MWRKISLLFLQLLLFVLLQALFFNHIRVYQYALPLVYLYPIFSASVKLPRWSIILSASLAGLLLDVFMNTMGINMFAATIVAFLRRPFLLIFMDEEELEEGTGRPDTKNLKLTGYLLYLLFFVTLLVSLTLFTEAFSVYMFSHLPPYIIGTSLLSILVTLIFHYFNTRANKLK